MRGCNLSWTILSPLSSALSSAPANLRELDLSYNNMGQSLHNFKGVLENPQCRLETLRSTRIFSFHYYNFCLLHFTLIPFFDLELVNMVCFFFFFCSGEIHIFIPPWIFFTYRTREGQNDKLQLQLSAQ